jgi:hypothetical protein
MSRQRTTPMSKRHSRILRAIMPVGILLLLVWIAWVALALIIGTEDFAIGWASAAFGLITALGLIVSGYVYRRTIAAR